MKAKTTEDFIKEIKKIYDDNFDLSKINYINNFTNVEIICKTHGSFFMTPNKILTRKNGCKKCNRNKIASETLKMYLKKSKDVHDNKYDYSKVDFINLTKKVIIICPIHGEFKQNLADHSRLHGTQKHKCGCPKCAGKNINTEEWINILSKIHNNKYDYSKFIYIHSTTKSEVICPEHGSFFISPSKHKNGGNCQLCAINIMSLKVRLKMIERINNNKFNGHQMTPSYNKKACKIFDEICEKENIHIQHAMNGGEYYIKELGYWLDGYDILNNTAYEFDEKYHFTKDKIIKDRNRQEKIEKFLKCKFIRLKDL